MRKLIVYTGPGSSNSWVWLADFLEEQGFLASRFVPNVGDIVSAPDSSTLVIPGGDTFRIAGAFGGSGLSRLRDKIRNGMGYIGICAGAYLPLRSSVAPLSSFNIMSARISNIASSLPSSIADSEKYSVRYGCSYVFHPARGPIRLSGDANLVAPIYGGPFLSPSDGERVHLSFSGTTAETELLVDIETYKRMSEGKAACIEQDFGYGRVLAIAPHLEHPDYPEANRYLRCLMAGFPAGEKADEKRSGDRVDSKALRGALADLRVLASSLESRSWKMGMKYWESEKFLFYIDAMRKRVTSGEGAPAGPEIMDHLRNAKDGLRALQGVDGESALESTVESLSNAASLYLTAHFAEKLAGLR